MRRTVLVLLLVFIAAQGKTEHPNGLKFEITVASGLISHSQRGRLLVVMGKNRGREPRFSVGETGMDAPPVIGRDATLGPGASATLDASCITFPIENLGRLPVGDYDIQAVFVSNVDLRSVNAPDNLYSPTMRTHLDPAEARVIKVELQHKVPSEQLPPETDYLKYVRLQSKILSDFHGRPIFLRAGIILPRGFNEGASQRYPLRVSIGGYGSRFTDVQRMMAPGSSFRDAWIADDTPRMILLHVDGDGPFGDCYQVNSANNGPYGDALTKELIPLVEKKFHAIGEAKGRVLDGGSTGGWVSLALQIFYPDYFNGCWSGYPDGVDFRAFQLINIYEDNNAYVNSHGFEKPSARDLNGDLRFTIRHECQMENVIGLGDSWTMSGEQWGAWNAVYGPRGRDGLPVPLWNPKNGAINREVAEQWKKYDLRLVLQQNWKTLGPKLAGKLTIWVGEADEYFLNNAVHLLDAFLSKADPSYAGKIIYGPGKGHGWSPFTERELMDQMIARIAR